MRRFALLLLLALLCGAAYAAMPQAGQVAPAFRLQDHNGHWLVMYFYPKDFTPGCTTEVCTFRDHIAKLRQAGADIIGISLDDVTSHAQFAAKYHMPFPLLADSSHRVATDYAVLIAMRDVHHARRITFPIGPDGKIAKIYLNVDPQQNSAQVLSDLAALKASS